MKKELRNLWRALTRRANHNRWAAPSPPAYRSRRLATEGLEIAPDDPIVAYFQSASKPVDVDDLDLDSPALQAIKATGMKVVVPLVSQGELIGLLNLGPRLSQQEYSADDYARLNNLATQASPAVRVAQLVREQQAEFQERERLEQELRIARLIQQTLLPKEVPQLRGWQVSAYYRPARETTFPRNAVMRACVVISASCISGTSAFRYLSRVARSAFPEISESCLAVRSGTAGSGRFGAGGLDCLGCGCFGFGSGFSRASPEGSSQSSTRTMTS